MSGWRKRQVMEKCVDKFKNDILSIAREHTDNVKFEFGTLFVEDVTDNVARSIFHDLWNETNGKVVLSKWKNESVFTYDFTE